MGERNHGKMGGRNRRPLVVCGPVRPSQYTLCQDEGGTAAQGEQQALQQLPTATTDTRALTYMSSLQFFPTELTVFSRVCNYLF